MKGSAADAAVCRCGHPQQWHWEGRCHHMQQQPRRRSSACDCTYAASTADVDRPETGKVTAYYDVTRRLAEPCHCGHRYGIHENGGIGGCPECDCAKYESEARRLTRRGELADLLADHQPIRCATPIDPNRCTCHTEIGWALDEYLRHLAAVLIAAGWEKR